MPPSWGSRRETLEQDLVLVGVQKSREHSHRAVDFPLLGRALAIEVLLSFHVEQPSLDDELLAPLALRQTLVVDFEHAELELAVEFRVRVAKFHLRQRQFRVDVVLRIELVALDVKPREFRDVAPVSLVAVDWIGRQRRLLLAILLVLLPIRRLPLEFSLGSSLGSRARTLPRTLDMSGSGAMGELTYVSK